ncbi:unnamed protein product [Gongylonema pulchrum]|uniref:Secreted protein n=1 Tax=Gongylonema pulchrum TaxID=637853 RepID=A0A183EK95_9BILA|nr:unnamed protein product [Gongylonema pulchrum]
MMMMIWSGNRKYLLTASTCMRDSSNPAPRGCHRCLLLDDGDSGAVGDDNDDDDNDDHNEQLSMISRSAADRSMRSHTKNAHARNILITELVTD